MVEVISSPRSLRDIDDIASHISKDSLQYAEEQVKQFFSKGKLVQNIPYSGEWYQN